jgi:chemotaxis protein CheD
MRFLHTEGIRVAGHDLLNQYPRKVYYFPISGRLLVKELRRLNNDTLAQREQQYRRKIAAENGGKVELFR